MFVIQGTNQRMTWLKERAMVIVEKPKLKEDRITREMKKDLAYQSKSGRGVGRIEASEGKVERVVEEGRMPYRPEIRLCIERARLVTEGYKQAEDDPIILKRAKALAHYLDNRTKEGRTGRDGQDMRPGARES